MPFPVSNPHPCLMLVDQIQALSYCFSTKVTNTDTVPALEGSPHSAEPAAKAGRNLSDREKDMPKAAHKAMEDLGQEGA